MDSMEFHGFHGIPWNPWNSIESMEFHGIHEIPWIPWNSMDSMDSKIRSVSIINMIEQAKEDEEKKSAHLLSTMIFSFFSVCLNERAF